MKLTILTGTLALATGLATLAAGQAAAPGQTGPKPKSKAETEAVIALQKAGQANDADAIIKAADDLTTKFTDSDYKAYALSLEAKAYQMKGDAPHAEVYAQQALQADPKSYSMTLLLGEVIEGHIGDHDLDRDDKLKSAAKNLNDTILLVNAAAKPNPALTDDQWAEYKKGIVAEAHNGLGLLAMIEKKYDVGISEFKMAVDLDPQDAYYTRLASCYQSAGKNDEAIAICDKLLANPSLHPTIKRFVEQIKTTATAAKKK